MAGVKGRSGRKPNERIWRQALTESAEVLTPQGKRRIEAAAEKLWERALEGDVSAIKELGDRIDGKSIQPTHVSGPDDGPVRIEYAWQSQMTQSTPVLPTSESDES